MDKVTSYIKECETEFMQLLGLTSFPIYGYTEYHAAQIGFLKVLGVKSIKQNISFSMSDFIDTESGYMSIQDYVDAPLLLANELIGHANFPTEFKVLKDTMGVIFNYFGRRSICKMYSKDYQDNADTSTIEKLLTHAMCSFLKTYLIGVLTNQQSTVYKGLHRVGI